MKTIAKILILLLFSNHVLAGVLVNPTIIGGSISSSTLNNAPAANLKTTGAAVNVGNSGVPGGSGYACITTDATHCTWQVLSGGGNALTSNPLSQFAATTSAQLAGVLSDATGTGTVVYSTNPILITPNLGTPSAINLTNGTALPLTGLASQAANTILANATAGSAAPTATSIGSCSTSGSALQWITSSGFSCNTSIVSSSMALGGLTGLGTGLPTALGNTPQGNGTKVQLSTGSPVSGNCAKFDANGNVVDNGTTCGGGSMTWPASAGIANYGGSNAWGTSYSAGNGNVTGTGNLVFSASPTFTGTLTGATLSISGLQLLGSSTGYTTFSSNNVGSSNYTAYVPAASGTILMSVTAPSTNPVTGTPSSANYLRGDGTWATPSGSGTVTNTLGNLTLNSVMLGNGTTDSKVSTGITSNGTAQLILGVNTSTLGSVLMYGSTSGSVSLQPAAIAGTSTTITLPTTTGTLAELGTNTFTGTQTFGTQAINTTGNIQLAQPSAGAATGPTTSSFNAGYTTALGDLVYLNSSGNWIKAEANSSTTSTNMMGIVLTAGITSGNPVPVALAGSLVCMAAFPTLTIGAPVYISDSSAGAVVVTQPSASGDVIRVMGYGTTSACMYFNPSSDYITHS